MRRLIATEPVSRAAVWSRRLALLGILVAVVAATASHGGRIDALTAVSLLGVGLALAVLALLAALVAAVVIWRTGYPGIGRALGGTALALLLLAYPAWLAATAAQLPQITDVSTDWTNPPLFSGAAKAVAARRGAEHPLPPEADRRAQLLAYPDVQPLTLDLDADEAYKAALKVVAGRRWRVIEARPPAGHPAIGQIEAVARTPIMGFSDDVAIRVTGLAAAQCRVDLRSASRIGRSDLGQNTSRLEALANDLDDAADQ